MSITTTLPKWVDTLMCAKQLVCDKCRNNLIYRHALMRTFELPDGAPDFTCPLGKPIVHTVLPGMPLLDKAQSILSISQKTKATTWSDVKAAYLKDFPEGLPEIELAEKQWTPIQGGCTSCQAKARMHRYMERLQAAIKAKKPTV